MLNKETVILNQAKLLFMVFGVLTVLISMAGYFTQGVIVLLYPIAFTITLTMFCTVVLFCFDYIKNQREKRFFSKDPFSEIEKRTIEKIQVFNSQYDFPKNVRIIQLDGKKYEVMYFDSFFRIPVSDVLVIQKLSEKESEPFILNYKTAKYSNAELLDLIRAI